MKECGITLLSGGLDSAVATLLARENVNIKLALTFDYGQRAFRQEMKAASVFCRHYDLPHKIVSLDWLKEISSPTNYKHCSIKSSNKNRCCGRF